jgi:glycosyltransferase involved in cell wall biosynthesis
MRVAIISDITPGNIGGVERFASTFKQQLEYRNMTVDAYDRGSINHWREQWFDKYTVSARSNWCVGRAALQAISAKETRPDIIIHNSIAGWNLRGQTKIPRIVIHHGTIRGLYYIDLPGDLSLRTRFNRFVGLICFGGWLEQHIAHDAVSVAVSSSVAEELRRYYSKIDPVIISNGIDVAHFSRRNVWACRKKYGLGEDDFVVCFTGRYGLLGKGFAELHSLAVLACQQQTPVKFLVATNHVPDGWPSNVIFVKNVPYEEMPDIYSAANVFVFPTRYEGCSYSLLEAMACGLPILTSRVGYAKDLVQQVPDFAPYIFDANSVELYWQQIKMFAEDKGRAESLGRVGAHYIQQHNSMESMMASYIQLIEQLCSTRRCGV